MGVISFVDASAIVHLNSIHCLHCFPACVNEEKLTECEMVFERFPALFPKTYISYSLFLWLNSVAVVHSCIYPTEPLYLEHPFELQCGTAGSAGPDLNQNPFLLLTDATFV